MSSSALMYAWFEAPEGLRPSERAVLTALAWYANAHGESIRPAVGRLMRMTGLSESTVHECRRSLKAAGVIEETGKGPRGEIEYRIVGVRDPDPPGAGPGGVQQPDPGGSGSRTQAVEPQEVPQELQHPLAPETLLPSPVEEVWAHYVQVMAPRRERDRQLRPDVKRMIDGALKDGFNVDDLKRAVDGCFASDWHMARGEFATRGKTNRPLHIFTGTQKKSRYEQITMFIERAEKSGGRARVASASDARVHQAIVAVRDAAEIPGDDVVVQRGLEEQRWLEEQGWKVEINGTDVNFIRPDR